MREAAPLAANDGIEAGAPSALPPIAAVVLRYAMSAIGPVSISAAHFIAALIFLHNMTRTDFGVLSFVFVIVSFCFSMSGALFNSSLVNAINGFGPVDATSLPAYMKANAIYCVAATGAVFGLMLAISATPQTSALIAGYGGVMSMRWFARGHAYATHKMPRAIASDLIYSSSLIILLGLAAFENRLTPVSAGMILALCSLCALTVFGFDFLTAQLKASFSGSLRGFAPVWRDLARWSLLGVVTTEAASNAHAYLVTFIAGPHAFALLAVGALFMRPVSLVLTALPDAERPALARYMAQKNVTQVLRSLSQFRIAGLAVLVGTIAVAAVIMIWFPQLAVKEGYDKQSIATVIGIFAVIMAIRVSRTPEAVLLQVVGEYRALSGASVRSSIVSIATTLGLLLAFGPLLSLLGIVCGETVGAHRVFVLARQWRSQNGF